MVASFSSIVAGWQNFYILAGTASATLVGLLFVAVSLHIDLIGESGAAAILSLARRTFTRFILVVVVALVFLVPRQDPEGLGLPLLAVGLVDGVRSVRATRLVIGTRQRNAGVEGIISRIVLPVVVPLASSAGLIIVAATLLSGQTTYLYWMVPIVALILTSAATSAWDLMLGLARYKIRKAAGEASSEVETTGCGADAGGPGRD